MSRRDVLVPCGGKWVGMVLALQDALRQVDALHGGRVLVADRDPLTPAGVYADGRFVVPPIAAPEYAQALVDVCAREGVRVVLPLIDIDLARLAPHAAEFAAVGATLVCPDPDIVALCLDKQAFQDFCDAEGLPTARPVPIAGLGTANYPLFYRRRNGFGSIGSGRADTFADARAALLGDPDLVFQEFVEADELSVDAFVNRDGRCVVRVPRVRDKVVGGEAQRSHTVVNAAVATLADRTIAALAARGLRGPLNVQIFDADPAVLIEVNTRLGSCSVLSNAATGGRLMRSVLEEAAGGTASGAPDDYEEGLAVYRFTGDVFHSGASLRSTAPARASQR